MTTPTPTIVKVNQAEFARLIGCDKSHVTRLKQHGRLVMVGEGRGALVDVEASKRRIAETEGGRDDVAARHAAAKGMVKPVVNETRADADTRSAVADANLKELNLKIKIGLYIERELVEQALADVVAFARQGMENMPQNLAGLLVGKDFEQINATLRQWVIDRMGDMHKEAGKRLAELTRVEG